MNVNAQKSWTDLPGAVLAITSNRTGNTEIFVVDAISGDARNVSRDPLSQNRYPMWSPDGSRIVFTSDRCGRNSYNLCVADLSGHGIRQLTNLGHGGICYFPTWHNSLIYFGYDPGNGSEALIARIHENGSGYEVVAPGRDPAISPDGRTIAFTQKVNTGYCVFTMATDGTQVRQLSTHENKIGAVTPTWSPDGARLLYSDEVNSKLELFCCDADGKAAKQLTHLQQYATSPAWSPDGRFITFRVTDYDYWNYPDAKEYAYSEKRADKRPVWIARADGTDAQIIETLHYQCAIDGSRAAWKPEALKR